MPAERSLQDFIDAMYSFGERHDDGRIEFNMDRLQELVRDNPEHSRQYVELACRKAAAMPGYVQPAAVVAIAHQLATGDRDLVEIVVKCADEVGGAPYLDRLAPQPRRAAPAGAAERQAARDWWRDRDEADAICDGCSDPLRRGEGYMVSNLVFSNGEVQIPAGDMLMCQRCFEKLQNRG
ncbi:hypothetical protein Lesp02_83120 [Lentzea sp. NBRC 105346]|uniref:hypothetical protein n=1 Tax=Lentzea sp. NBRC 105346 TaxID=3032205 RepID=UPI0024A28B1B|nr:hypothetical protein [Lentzea sp. NBRC 105346]GLZ36125.1 hypothetical protein Lesp02_83120 [Lentzea sp. NBRC 105346]